jgi:hypothetical protein
MDSQKFSQNALFLQDTFAKITWSSVRAEPDAGLQASQHIGQPSRIVEGAI